MFLRIKRKFLKQMQIFFSFDHGLFLQKKDFIEQYLNKLSYLPGDVITNSEPLLGSGVPGGIGSQPGGHSGAPFITTSYTSPFLTGAATTTAAPGGISTSGINDLLAETTMYNSLSSCKKSFFVVVTLCIKSNSKTKHVLKQLGVGGWSVNWLRL